ncbi:MAG: glycerol-3-phosphate dehydrogenase [Pseudomonadota bacterium]
MAGSAETAPTYDLAIIGGGINGCGIARDAAGRGYSVFLAEKDDLARGTSSGSTKLIHGGLRYLEHYEFRLVRESLKEREVLWAMAPHIIWPLRFVLPYTQGLRPAWLLRLGLFIYDHIGGRKALPATRTLDLRTDPAGAPLKPGFAKAFEYSDCWVDDARLVVLNAMDAAARGAVIKTRTAVTRISRDGAHWTVTTLDENSGRETSVSARMVINAAGPWVDEVLGRVAGRNDVRNVRLVQGSHIVVPKLFAHEQCYIFQNPDGRIFFAVPYEQEFTLIGTTDHDFQGDLDEVKTSESEVDYICAAASHYFATPITRDQVVWTYSAVRPLYDDGASKAQEATRDYVLKIEGTGEDAKLLNIFGGKITTYRRLAQAVLDDVDRIFDRETVDWTASEPLPGGDFPFDGYDDLAAAIAGSYPFLETSHVRRLVRCYGTLTREILGDAQSLEDLGTQFGAGLSEREVEYLRAREWAMTADDILWRRSKLGLRLSTAERVALADWLSCHPAQAHAA